MIELRFQLPDPRRRLAGVRLAHQLGDRLPHVFKRRGRTWELEAPAPDVARFEYQLELIGRDDGSEWVVDPANPRTASGPWGAKSVWEEPGYEPPAWLDGHYLWDAVLADLHRRAGNIAAATEHRDRALATAPSSGYERCWRGD